MNSFQVSRRGFLVGSAAAIAAVNMPGALFAEDAGKPCSKFAGVQIGTITYSFRSLPCSAEQVLSYVVKCGIDSIELMGDVAERYAGNPKRDASASMEKFEALRKMYNDAGVKIHIVKFGDIGNKGMPDAQMDYYFRVAKALGATGITRELDEGAGKRAAPFADKYQIYLGFHTHEQLRPDTYDGTILSYSKYLGINMDIGHFVAANDYDPLKMIEKYHDRIISLHMKDRQTKAHGKGNLPWGKGDTPIGPILKMMSEKHYTFPVDIELEYGVPKDSDAVKEVAKCVAFCKKALLG